MNNERKDIVIIGGGHAGGELAFRLRQEGFSGSIALLSAEPHLPYNRPPLSKGFLAGEVTIESLLLRTPAAYEKFRIDWHAQTLVTEIDRVDHLLSLGDGRKLEYGQLVLATGGRPRVLPVPGGELSGVHVLRSIADVEKLHPEFKVGRKLVIVGAGYIGLEVAAVAVKVGLAVEIVEFAPRALARVAGPALSAFYEEVHTKAGVVFRFNTGVEGFLAAECDPSRVGAIRCTGGETLTADFVLVAAGLVPNVELAQQAGLDVGNGILVDGYCRTSDPDILAIGDCAEFPLPFLDHKITRLESVPNAAEHARIAASVLTGNPRVYAAIPWFWSDQYHYKLQSVGLSQGYDQEVVRRSLREDSFVVFYLREERMLAADCVNATPEFIAAKRLVAERVAVDPAVLADPHRELKSLLTASNVKRHLS